MIFRRVVAGCDCECCRVMYAGVPARARTEPVGRPMRVIHGRGRWACPVCGFSGSKAIDPACRVCGQRLTGW